MTPAQAPLDRTRPPELLPAPPLMLPHLVSQRLANGLDIAVVEMHRAPVADVTLIVRAGAVRDPADLPGLATFTAAMLDEGAGSRSSLEIAEELEYLGADLTISTGLEAAQLNLHAPKRSLAAALDVLSDIVLRPTFPEGDITRQRDLRAAGAAAIPMAAR